MKMRRFLVVSLVLVACDGSETSSGGGAAASAAPTPTTAPIACSLLTNAEATSALGAPATSDESKTAGASSRCTYDASSGGLIVIVSDQGKTAYDKAHAAAAAKPPGAFAELSGMGEGGFATYGGPVASVMFHKGAFAVTIILTVTGAPKPPLDKATVLGRDAQARI